MNRGDVVKMTTATGVDGRNRFTFKCPSGVRMVFLYLGTEDDAQPLNAHAAVLSLGFREAAPARHKAHCAVWDPSPDVCDCGA